MRRVVEAGLELDEAVAARVELLLDALHGGQHGGHALRRPLQLLLHQHALLALLVQLPAQHGALVAALFPLNKTK